MLQICKKHFTTIFYKNFDTRAGAGIADHRKGPTPRKYLYRLIW